MNILTHNNILLRSSIVAEAKGDIWFIHGFGESGLSFIEAFDSPLADKFNLYVPDMPGFGASPYPDTHPNQKQTADILYDLIQKISKTNSIYLVGHSQGGLVATWLCQKLGDQVCGYVNVEGNLTKADVTFSGEAAKQSTPDACKAHILRYVETHAQDESYWRYYASLRLASPDVLLTWAKAGLEFTGETKGGEEYAALPTRKLFIGGIKSHAPMTRHFIESHQLNHYYFEHSGHWPMIDDSVMFYDKVREFVSM